MHWNPAGFVIDPSTMFPWQRSIEDFNKVCIVNKYARKVTLIGGGRYPYE